MSALTYLRILARQSISRALALGCTSVFVVAGVRGQVVPAPGGIPAPHVADKPPLSQPTQLAVAAARAQVKAGQFAEAAAALTAAATPGLTAADRQALDFALADAQNAWGAVASNSLTATIERYQIALAIDRQYPERAVQSASDLRGIGKATFQLNQVDSAVKFYEEALAICISAADKAEEKHTERNLAFVLRERGDSHSAPATLRLAIPDYDRALALNRKAGEREGEAVCLGDLAITYDMMGQTAKAASYNEQAWPIFEAIHLDGNEATALKALGDCYGSMGRSDLAAQRYEHALTAVRRTTDPASEASILNALGGAYCSLGAYEKALDASGEALKIYQKIHAAKGEAQALGNVGNAYLRLANLPMATEFSERALSLLRQTGDTLNTARQLGNLAIEYAAMGQSERAEKYNEQSFTLARQMHNPEGLRSAAANLNSMAVVSLNLNRTDEATRLFAEALRAHRDVSDAVGAAQDLSGLASASLRSGHFDRAIAQYGEALPAFRIAKDRAGEADTFGKLMLAWAAATNKRRDVRLAALYGKEAINVQQDIRTAIVGLDKQTRKSYTAAVSVTYRTLADILIEQGRLSEAEEVLGLLKESEYFDFVRRDQAVVASLKRANLTPVEKIWADRYQKIAGRVTALGTRRQELADTKPRTPAQEAEYAQVKADLETSSHAFQVFLTDISVAAAGESLDKASRVLQIKQSQALQADLGELGPGTVAVYVLVTPDYCKTIVVTSNSQTAGEYPIKEADLNRLVFRFRNSLQDPTVDPLPLAKRLYDILIGPVAKNLADAKATVMMWSLDGTLRYLPIAALSRDGKHYLVEDSCRYSEFTPASDARLKDPAHPKRWDVLALGVSKAHGDFPELKGVPGELGGIVRGTGPGRTTLGILPGAMLLDEPFTLAAMESRLDDHPLVVHIASHFAFRPGDETASFLLLGDGSHLTLDALRAKSGLFSGVELLTLSACQTGIGSDSGGRVSGTAPARTGQEIEGFGMLAQDLGAKAVLATLWPVADASTQALMLQFYRQREARPELTKAEALRRAQLTLLTGKVKPAANSRPRNVSASHAQTAVPAPAEAPPFTPDPAKPWAHPYYWAPFILIGNWK